MHGAKNKSIDSFPTTEQPNQVAVLDFLGNGTACIVWSSPLPEYMRLRLCVILI